MIDGSGDCFATLVPTKDENFWTVIFEIAAQWHRGLKEQQFVGALYFHEPMLKPRYLLEEILLGQVPQRAWRVLLGAWQAASRSVGR